MINIMPTPIEAPFFDEPNILGSKKSTPASIQSVGANLCNIGLLFSGAFSFFIPISLTYRININTHNVLVKRRSGAASGGASLLAERT